MLIYKEVALDILNLLSLEGVSYDFDLNNLSKNDILHIAEACNWAAKIIDEKYYDYKAKLIAAIIISGEFIFELDDYHRCYYIYDDNNCQFSFHDPYREIDNLINEYYYDFKLVPKRGPCHWIGIPLQHLSFDALKSKWRRNVINYKRYVYIK